MLSNAYFLAKFRFDKAENEPAKIFAQFSKNAFCNPGRASGVLQRGDRAVSRLLHGAGPGAPPLALCGVRLLSCLHVEVGARG